MTQQIEGQAFRNFSQSLRSAATKKDYLASLSYYMTYLKAGPHTPTMEDYEALIKDDPSLIQSYIIDYLIYLREERKLAPNSIKSYLAGVKRFYDMNDITINWKRVWMYQGESYKVVDDTAYSAEQIKLMVDNADMRDKAIILLLASTGMRGGALPKLKLKDLTPIDNLYKIRVYKHTHEQYYTFCTPECRRHLDDYLDYRRRSGERLKEDSPMFRRRFNPDKNPHIQVRPISFSGIASIISHLLNLTGVRPTIPLEAGKHPAHTNLPMIHGFRKFFVTQCIRAKVEFGARESLTGHKKGLDSHYDRRNESEYLAEYSKAIDLLTIDPKNRLERRVAQLTIKADRVDELSEDFAELKRRLGLS
jgi:integrase